MEIKQTNKLYKITLRGFNSYSNPYKVSYVVAEDLNSAYETLKTAFVKDEIPADIELDSIELVAEDYKDNRVGCRLLLAQNEK
jgi:hypothetical protein